jgi:hypothetical protein
MIQVRRMVRRLTRKYIIWNKTNNIGGRLYRDEARDCRRAFQRKLKTEVIEDLIRSWEIGEIKTYTQQERYDILNIGPRLSWKFLTDLQKKYRGENI